MATKKYTDEEARLRKNERQKDYVKRTKYAADIKSKKKNTKRYILQLTISTELDIIKKLDEEKNKSGYAAYLKNLIREDMSKDNS